MYLTQSLHRAVQQHPERPAVRAGATVRSYREFVDRVARLGGRRGAGGPYCRSAPLESVSVCARRKNGVCRPQ